MKWVLIAIIAILIYCVITLFKKCMRLETKEIKLQNDLNNEKDKHIKTNYLFIQYKNMYEKLYNQLTSDSGMIINHSPQIIEDEYNLDDILNEITKKGIKNIDKKKLNYLKNYGKNDTQ
jgi:hypothetical protein